MTRILSTLLIILTIAWTSAIQAFPLHIDDSTHQPSLKTQTILTLSNSQDAFAAGLSAEQLATELTLATIAIEHNFEASAKSLKENAQLNPEKEEKKSQDNTDAPVVDGREYYIGDNVDNRTTGIKKSLSLTSLYLYEQKMQAEAELEQTEGFWNRYEASSKVAHAKQRIAARPLHRTAGHVKTYAKENPGKTTAFVGICQCLLTENTKMI